MKIDNVKRILSKYDENLGIELADDELCYLYVSTDKHKYYIVYFDKDEIRDKKDLLFYLDDITAREI